MNAPSLREPSHFESKRFTVGNHPPLGISRPSSSSFGVTQEWCASTIPLAWDVKCRDLELLNPDFPLERTHREIYDDTSKVAVRISEVLRALSIETEFDCANAKAKCKTNDCVSFRIRLYAGSESGEPVIVEVQRRNGSASSFMCSCRAILDAAEGKVTGRKPSSPPCTRQQIGMMKCLQSIPPSAPPPSFSLLESPIENVMVMLRSDQHDTNILGLENLRDLTDPVKVTPAIAIQASRSVIICEPVREEIRALTDRDVLALDEAGLANHKDQLRHLALIVFSNALSVCSKQGCLMKAVQEQKWFADYLIPILLDELKHAESSANNAYLAASCLHSLLSISEVAKQLVVLNGGVASLDEANAFGTLRHGLLAKETRLCLNLVASLHSTSLSTNA